MGLFNSYLKDGPGVDVNAPKKKGIFLYLEILGRKFIPMMKAGGLYFLLSIPFILVALLVLAPQYRVTFVSPELIEENPMSSFLLDILFAGMFLNFFGSGPASAAYAYVMRSFTRSEPVWVASDGWDYFKSNFKQAILLSVTDVIVIYMAIIALRFYASSGTMFSLAFYYIILTVFIIYAIAHTFMYQIMVTYECSLKDNIKNSIIFTFAKLPMCILLTAITGIICALIFSFLGIMSIFVYPILGMMFTKFPLEFYGARVIEKNIQKTTPQGDNE